MSSHELREEVNELREQLTTLRDETARKLDAQSAELEKYRLFWEKEWPRTRIAMICVASTLVVGTGFAIALGTKSTRRLGESKQLDALRAVFELLFDAEHTEQRRAIYTRIAGDPLQASDDDWRIVHSVINCFEMIGYLVSANLLSEFHARNLCYVPAVRVWYKLHPYVKHVRRERGDDPATGAFGQHFQELAKQCSDHWESCGMKLPPDYY